MDTDGAIRSTNQESGPHYRYHAWNTTGRTFHFSYVPSQERQHGDCILRTIGRIIKLPSRTVVHAFGSI